MSNYIKAVDFAAKDSLLTGDPLKIVSGTEIDDEYNAIQTAINSKANTNSPALTGSPTAPTATAGTNTTQLSTTAFVTGAVNTLDASLGSMADQDADSVNIDGGTIDNTVIGGATAAAITGTTITGTTITATTGFTGDLTGDVTGTATSAEDSLGNGQTWQDLTGSRTTGVTYTNSTGRTITVVILILSNSGTGSGNYSLTIDGSVVLSDTWTGTSWRNTITLPIPAGGTYSINGAGTFALNKWAELR